MPDPDLNDRSLTIALEKVDFLPPARVTDDTSVLTLKNLVFEPLLKWDRGLVLPGLFARWTFSPDGREWLFEIRENAMFHDGKPCVAADIIGFIDGILGAVDTFGMKWSYARYLADAEIRAVDDRHVRVRNPQPIADILDIFSEFYICRIAPDGSATLGTGPYRVSGFEPGQRAVLERVAGPAGPQRIVALADRSAGSRLERLRRGEADAVLNLERVHGRLETDPQFQWGKAVNTLSVMYYLNCGQGLFRSPQARLAVNLAVDREAVVRDIFHGLAVPSTTIVSPFHLGMRSAALPPFPHDPARARALLDEAGGSDRILLRTPTYMPERAPEISAFVAQSLREAGLTVDVETEPDRPEYARQIGRKEMGDMAIFDSSPHSTYRILNDKISASTRAVWWQGFEDSETETLIAAANNAVTDEARESAYGRTLRRLHDNPPWLYVIHPVEVFAARKDVAGLSIDNKGTLVIR